MRPDYPAFIVLFYERIFEINTRKVSSDMESFLVLILTIQLLNEGVNPLEYVIEMLNIRKEFGNFVANDNITLQLKKGEIHALLGENGAGKSTLMNVLFGLYQPEGGEIRVRGQKVTISDPNVANNLRYRNGSSTLYAS